MNAEQQRFFLNNLKKLFFIEGSQLPELSAEQQKKFLADPVRYLIRARPLSASIRRANAGSLA